MASGPPPLKIVITPGAGKKKPKTPAQKAADAAAVIKAKADSAAYIAAQELLREKRQAAALDNHASDPWVIPVIGKHGEVTGFRYATGVTAPKNTLKYGGEPLTKAALYAVWTGGGYSNAYQQYTGRVARPSDIVAILGKGLTVIGMQGQLAKLPGFEKSPIYLAHAGDVTAAVKAIWGTAAPKALIHQAISQEWDTNTLGEHLRKDPRYLQGPEYKTNFATMKDAYQQIYGAPDANAMQSIGEAAANGWTTAQFATYLRDQPQYKTSLEYQANTVNFLDAMGLFTGSRATLLPGATAPTGGTAVTNAPVVPGVPKPLNPVLPFTPSLPGSPNLGAAPTPAKTPAAPDYGPADSWMREPWVVGA